MKFEIKIILTIEHGHLAIECGLVATGTNRTPY